MNLSERIIIVSAYQASETETENLKNHESLKTYLALMGIGFQEIDGKYDGKLEKSIVLAESNRRVAEIVLRDYNQECYLESHVDRFSELVFADGTRKPLGYLRPVSHSEAETLDAWSYRRDLNQYYAIKEA